MAIPAPTATVVGGPLTLTLADSVQEVTCTDTADPYTPAATARTWQVNATDVDSDVTSTTYSLGFAAAGTYPVAVEVTNADGTAASTPVNVVVSDALVDTPLALIAGTARIQPADLPVEYRDAQKCTPGIPTVANVNDAKLYGTVGVGANVVLADGTGAVVSLV